jgi:hypothetical protein
MRKKIKSRKTLKKTLKSSRKKTAGAGNPRLEKYGTGTPGVKDHPATSGNHR